MYEYLAATCARAGGLLAALSEDRVDRELLTAAGEIIQALIAGGPAEGIDDYEDARPVIESYLGHMASSAETVEDFLHVNSIKGYLDEDDSRWAGRYDAGWTSRVPGRAAVGVRLDPRSPRMGGSGPGAVGQRGRTGVRPRRPGGEGAGHRHLGHPLAAAPAEACRSGPVVSRHGAVRRGAASGR